MIFLPSDGKISNPLFANSVLQTRKDMEQTVFKIFSCIGFDIGKDKTESCHRLINAVRTIVNFSRSKDCQHLMCVEKVLKAIDPTIMSFPEGTKNYLTDSLCLHYKEY